ncbi:17982_t:CDS:2, partial [Funneliformis geosporum]
DDIEELNEDLEELKNISDLIDEQEKRKIAALIAKLYIVHHNEISLATEEGVECMDEECELVKADKPLPLFCYDHCKETFAR